MKPIEQLSDEKFLRLVEAAAALRNAPPDVVQAAIELWRTARPAPPVRPVVQALRRFVAALDFDSRTAAPLALGMRSAGSATRHLLFSAVGRDIDLRVTQQDGQYDLAGQILGPDADGEIEVATDSPSEGLALRISALSPMGEFHIAGIGQGRYRLTLRTAGDEIVLPPIDVGEPQP